MKKIMNINEIVLDSRYQLRKSMSQELIQHYSSRMKEGDEFPALTVNFCDGKNYLIGGFHRIHAYKLVGAKTVEVDFHEMGFYEALNYAHGLNADHGQPRTNEDKRKDVLVALENPLNIDASDYEIAKICHVSKPFVASIRNPSAKEKQKENLEKFYEKKGKKSAKTAENSNSITTGKPLEEVEKPVDDGAPSPQEIEESKRAIQADIDSMKAIIEADDKLQEAMNEIHRLNLRLVQSDLRNKALQNENAQAVRMIKDLEKQLKKARKEK